MYTFFCVRDVCRITESEPVIQGKKDVHGRSQSMSESSEDEETGDESSLMGASISSQLEEHVLPSSFHSVSSLYTVTSEKSRKKWVPLG